MKKKITPAKVKAEKNLGKRNFLDMKMDRQKGVKEGSKQDVAMDKKMGVFDKQYGKGKSGKKY